MFANVQNLKVFVMSSRIVPVAAARLCHSGSRRPVPVDAAFCRPLLVLVGGVVVAGCRPLLPLLVGGVVACCCPLLLADRQPKVSDRQMIILKLCVSVSARVFGCGSES
jgi:hypothetical protein